MLSPSVITTRVARCSRPPRSTPTTAGASRGRTGRRWPWPSSRARPSPSTSVLDAVRERVPRVVQVVGDRRGLQAEPVADAEAAGVEGCGSTPTGGPAWGPRTCPCRSSSDRLGRRDVGPLYVAPHRPVTVCRVGQPSAVQLIGASVGTRPPGYASVNAMYHQSPACLDDPALVRHAAAVDRAGQVEQHLPHLVRTERGADRSTYWPLAGRVSQM